MANRLSTGLLLPESLKLIEDKAFANNLTQPVIAYRNTGLQGLKLLGNPHLAINPIKLILHYKDAQGKTVAPSSILFGTGKENLQQWTPATAKDYFQLGQTFLPVLPSLPHLTAPSVLPISLPTQINPQGIQKELTFTYTINKLVLHYAFDDTTQLGKDSSPSLNHANPSSTMSFSGRLGKGIRLTQQPVYSQAPVEALAANHFTLATWLRPESLKNQTYLLQSAQGATGFKI